MSNTTGRPEAQCLEESIHDDHDWASLSHQWWCPGRTETKADKLRRYEATIAAAREEGQHDSSESRSALELAEKVLEITEPARPEPPRAPAHSNIVESVIIQRRRCTVGMAIDALAMLANGETEDIMTKEEYMEQLIVPMAQELEKYIYGSVMERK